MKNCHCNCNCKCSTYNILYHLLDAAKKIDMKRVQLSDALDYEIESFDYITDSLLYAGEALLNIDSDSYRGDDYCYAFFQAIHDDKSIEETIAKLMKL